MNRCSGSIDHQPSHYKNFLNIHIRRRPKTFARWHSTPHWGPPAVKVGRRDFQNGCSKRDGGNLALAGSLSCGDYSFARGWTCGGNSPKYCGRATWPSPFAPGKQAIPHPSRHKNVRNGSWNAQIESWGDWRNTPRARPGEAQTSSSIQHEVPESKKGALLDEERTYAKGSSKGNVKLKLNCATLKAVTKRS